MKINDLIFKELIKRGYALEGNTRVWNIADSKLWYLTPTQAQAYLDLERSEAYQKEVIQKEIDLIQKNLEEIGDNLGKGDVNIIDVGCGDGKKAVLFIDHLKKNNQSIRYCPIDISHYMVTQAFARVRKLDVDEVIGFHWNISDFENLENVSAIIRAEKQGNNLFLLLGNTLGNFEINELLYEMRSSMTDGEVLLIGNGLNNGDTESLLKSYDHEENNVFFKQIPSQLGLEEGDIGFGVRFSNSRIELYYTLNTDKKITFQNKTVHFQKGDQIIVAVSYKYDFDDFKSLLKMYFGTVRVFASEDKSYALALCMK